MKKIELQLSDFERPNQNFNIEEDSHLVAGIVLDTNDKIISKIFIDHTISNLKARIDLRFVLCSESYLDLEVFVKVSRDIKDVDTYLSIKVLMANKKAYARVIPSIEISENAVKCGHGATIGTFDPNQTSYLTSRGLSEEQAKTLIMESFLKI